MLGTCAGRAWWVAHDWRRGSRCCRSATSRSTFRCGSAAFSAAKSGYLYAVDGVSFTIAHGETLGLVGESGCGKSTVGKTVLKLIEPTAGEIVLDGVAITDALAGRDAPAPSEDAGRLPGPLLLAQSAHDRGRDRRRAALQLQARRRAGSATTESASSFARVGLRPEHMRKYPHEFSGGQRQRLGIARALALRPKLIVGDEPVSALDVSVQAQVINLHDGSAGRVRAILPLYRP